MCQFWLERQHGAVVALEEALCAPFMEDAPDSLAVCSLSRRSEPICILQLS